MNSNYRRMISEGILDRIARPDETREQTCARWIRELANDIPQDLVECLNHYREKQKALLVEIDRLAQGTGVSYWLDGNSLKDALLSGKSYPWSFDMAISMTRPDYMRLYPVIKSSPVLDIKYRITDMGLFPYIEHRDSDDGMCTPVVDVSLFDFVAFSSLENAERFWNTVYATVRHNLLEDLSEQPATQQMYSLCGEALNFLHFPPEGQWLIQDVTGGNHDTAGMMCFEMDMVFPIHRVPFEGITVPVPNQSTEYAKRQTGELWLVPERTGFTEEQTRALRHLV